MAYASDRWNLTSYLRVASAVYIVKKTVSSLTELILVESKAPKGSSSNSTSGCGYAKKLSAKAIRCFLTNQKAAMEQRVKQE